MMSIDFFVRTFVFCLVWSSVQGKPRPEESSDEYAYDDEYFVSDDEAREDEEVEFKVEPKFQMKGRSFTFDKGTTIKLPCVLDQFPRNYVVMWKKITPQDEAIIFVGDKSMVREADRDRFQVELRHEGEQNGSTLIIGLATEKDAGQYVCVLGSNVHKEIRHIVHVRAPPEISKSPRNGLVLAKKGDSVSLSCEAEGDSPPTITWERIGKRLPDGSRTMVAEELLFSHVTHRHSGTYVCTADNGYGQSARERIEVSVEFKPEVEVEELFVHAIAGNQVELVCLVHAHPTAVVKWFKNSMELTDETAKLERHGHKHVLKLPSVTKADLGNYTCRAENKLGFANMILEVSGKAGFANFRSAPRGNEPYSFLVEWQSESRTPITSFELKYRELGARSWRSLEIVPIKLSSFVYAGKHSITGLMAATRYEATVAAKNNDGWSRHAPIFNFATFGAEPLTDNNSASTSRSHLSSLLLSFTVFALSWNLRL